MLQGYTQVEMIFGLFIPFQFIVIAECEGVVAFLVVVEMAVVRVKCGVEFKIGRQLAQSVG